jgi:hypothetical protein
MLINLAYIYFFAQAYRTACGKCQGKKRKKVFAIFVCTVKTLFVHLLCLFVTTLENKFRAITLPRQFLKEKVFLSMLLMDNGNTLPFFFVKVFFVAKSEHWSAFCHNQGCMGLEDETQCFLFSNIISSLTNYSRIFIILCWIRLRTMIFLLRFVT